MIIIYLPIDSGWKIWCGSTITRLVSIETVAPLHDIAPAECARLTVELCQEHLALFQQIYGCLTIGNLTPLIGLQDAGMHTEQRVQEAYPCVTWLSQSSAWWRSRLTSNRPLSKRWSMEEATLGICQAKGQHCGTCCNLWCHAVLNRHTVMNDWCFRQY